MLAGAVMAADPVIVRLAAVADLHCEKDSDGALRGLFAHVAEAADIVLLCGDLTNYGVPEEAEALVKEMALCLAKPVLAVLGNHDYESGRQDEVREVMARAGVRVLDGTACEVLGIGFAGTKGFGGGFDRHILEPWGEQSMKQMVKEGVDEAMKLETALARLRTQQRVVLLHYAPIQATVKGEPLEIYPFLGCSRLEEPLNRYPVTVVFHGHAHHGAPEGRTKRAVRVHNVAWSLLRRHFPDRPPFHLEELAVANTSALPVTRA